MMFNFLLGTFFLITCSNHGHAFLLQRTSLLQLWSRHVEVGAKTLRVPAGNELSVTCDGASSGPWSQTLLSWYGPDRHIIAYEGQNNRISIERALTPRFQELHFRPVRGDDGGTYYCRGRFGAGTAARLEYRFFNLIVVNPNLQTEPIETTVTTVELTTEQRVPTTPAALTINQTTIATGNCTAPNFLCNSGECFEGRYRCDRFPDCTDGSDEEGCVLNSCTEGQMSCADGSACIQSDLFCNSHPDCQDGSDEDACP